MVTATAFSGHPELWRRYLHLIMDSLRKRPDDSTPLLDTGFGEAQMVASFDRGAEQRAKRIND
ncbi:hypothetical protein [Actinacidiphila soli]|uniref:hypothetical protein n=1 Tax=Actinacidiphila soli TaxID=2487275 RepID=UPI0013E2FD6F|nr:hypothetical protein [Actinacidiphila soli]